MWISRILCGLVLLAAMLGVSVARVHAAPTPLGVGLASAFQPGAAVDAAAAASAKWKQVLSRVTEENACPVSAQGCDTWNALKAKLHATKDRKTLIARVNDALNRLDYIEDRVLWRRSDYWASPSEFLGRGAGDCEDYAIAKYFMLRELGVAAEAMRIAIVRDVKRRLMHAVLVVQTESGPVMLDNVIDEVVPAAGVPHYRAVLAINHTVMTVLAERLAASTAGS